GNPSNGHHPVPTGSASPNGPTTPVPAPLAAPTPVPVPAPALVPSAESPLLVEALRASQESLVALQRLQEQTARLHAQYLQGQEVTQQSFMALIERQQQLFGTALGLAAPVPMATPIALPVAQPVVMPQPVVQQPVVVQPPVYIAPAQPVVVAPAPAPVVPVHVPVPVPKPVAAPAASNDIVPVLLAVVAEKTGYPTDMLGLEMSLEADLGIDSIKRVEILSAIQERLPHAPVIKPDQLGTLVTLADVVSHLSSPQAGAAPAKAEVAAAAPAASNDVVPVLLAVVAEKTGYPTDMLGLEMSLEADLGIDSIKRVEILSAIQERLPHAPVIKPDQLGTMVTLADVAQHLGAGAPPMAAPVAVPVAAVVAAVAAVGAAAAALVAAPVAAPQGVQAVVIAVVAEKTGYPTDMLTLDMALEADLGIDSIKRVEILSAVQEVLPGAPVVKPDHIGTLSTLRQLIAHLEGTPAEATVVVPAQEAPPVAAPIPEPTPAPTPAPVLQFDDGDPATDAPSWEPITGLQRLILRAVPLAASPEREAGKLPFGSEVWVADDGAPLAKALHDRLLALGFKVRQVDLANEAAWPEAGNVAGLFLVADVNTLEGPVWGRSRERFLASALYLTQRVEPSLRRANGALVTVSRLDGGFGLLDLDPKADATAGGLAGLAKTAGLEWPEVACQALDVDRTWTDDAAIAADLVRELFLDGPSEVGLRAAERLALITEETPIVPPATAVPIYPGELVIVTGGARGVTAEAAVALARYVRPTLVLFGRSPAPTPEPAWLAGQETEAGVKAALLSDARAHGAAPTPRELEDLCRQALANREVLRTLDRIDAEGGQAIYQQLDVRDARAVAAAIADLRTAHGPVRGLVHGAGVLADRRIGDLTREQIDAVLATKVEGLRHLLAAIGDDDLRALALFSSITGRRGRVGQVAYAVANEVLDKVAQQQARLRPRCRVTAINWGPWDGGMVTPALKRMFADEGVGVVPLDAGAALLVQELAQPAGAAVEVLVLGVPATAAAAPRPLANLDDRPPRMQTAFSRWLAPKQYPFLTSHVINGRAVLPVAVIVEWLAHGALHANPGLTFHGIEDLRVFKGVILAEDAPYGIRVAASPARRDEHGRQRVVVELRGTGENDVLHARANVLLVPSDLPAPPAQPPAWPAQGAYPRSVADAYRDVLFHGPDFRGIGVVERCAADGIAAEVMVAPPPRAWIESPLRDTWLADPLALDAAFQLLILWSVEQLNAPCLPSHIESYQQFRPTFPADGVTVVVKVAERHASQVRADVAFLDRAGQVVALMRAECTSDAGLAEAFRRNELTLQP
ncbi:MAG: polyketide synthase family protein, partial [Cyanobacteria bacterium RYN_339]|nr:polyketide synthase family protein [Cyanobacteria bacterium RYN_339]